MAKELEIHKGVEFGEDILPQEEGLKRLRSFLIEGADFDTLVPFYLDLSIKKPSNFNTRRYVFVFVEQSEVIAQLSFALPEEIFITEEKKVLAVPKKEKLRDGSSLARLDLYKFPSEATIDNALPFTSKALHPEKAKRKIQNVRLSYGSEDEDISIPRDSYGRPRWKQLSEENPEKLKRYIEFQARDFIASGNVLKSQVLLDSGKSSLAHCIYRYYPGGLTALRKTVDQGDTTYVNLNLEIDERGLPRDKRGRVYWSRLAEDPEQIQRIIEQEAQRFISGGNPFTQSNLKDARMSGFGAAIQKHYPGGIEGLKEKLGIDISKRPQGYWRPETIRREALEFYDLAGGLTFTLLDKHKAAYLEGAIGRYPGGIGQLRKDLGIRGPARKPLGYWNPEQVEEEARQFLEKEGDLTVKLLSSKNRHDLLGAIAEVYPGNLTELKIKLGVERTSKPRGYWTPENTELEALEFLEELGEISQGFLIQQGRSDLVNAIRKYPGGMYGLKEKLGVGRISISPEEADEELKKLTEG